MKALLNTNLLKARKEDNFLDPDGRIMENTGRHGRRNNNTLLVGSSGSGKTFGKGVPEVLAGAGGSSMVIADVKNTIHDAVIDELLDMDYDIYCIDTVELEYSMCYNPLEYADTPDDAMKLSDTTVYLGVDKTALHDPFWKQSEKMLFNAVYGYFAEGGRVYEKNMYGVNRLLSEFDADALADHKPCNATRIFERHNTEYKKRTGRQSWAYEQFVKFTGINDKTFSTVLVEAYGDICEFDTHEMRRITGRCDFDLKSIGDRKTAIFINVSDTDRSKDKFINIFYTQLMDTLCRYADSLPDKHLPVPVRFILDDFGSSAKIEGFENIISNIRSRGISVMLMIQSLAQLERGYGRGADTILANCATKIYMGGSDPGTAKYFSTLTGKPLDRILNMPYMTHWTVRQGERPRFGKTLLLSDYALTERELDGRQMN